MKPYLRMIILVLVALNSACATLSREECVQGSWHSLGLQDGRAGATYKRLGEHQKACSEYGVRVDNEQYKAGRQQGLNDYCQLDNAIDMGLKGNRYQSVCPSDIHSDFKRHNRAAYDVYQRKEELEKLDKDLLNKESRLLSSKLTDDDRKKIRRKISDLDRKRQRLRDRIYSSERELDRLRRNTRYRVPQQQGQGQGQGNRQDFGR